MPEEFKLDDEMDTFGERPVHVEIDEDATENDVLDPIDDYDLIQIREQLGLSKK